MKRCHMFLKTIDNNSLRGMSWAVLAMVVALGAVAPAGATPAGDLVLSLAGGPSLGEALDAYRGDDNFAALEAEGFRGQNLGIDPVLLGAVVARSAEHGLPATDVLTILDHAAGLAEEGLPAEPVLSRYVQGLSKGIPLPRIETVATAVETRLRTAAHRVDARLAETGVTLEARQRLLAIDNAAYALGVGVSEEHVDRSLALACQTVEPAGATGDFSASVLTMSTLVAAGVEGDRSYELLSSAWQQGYRGNDLERLGHAVAELGRGAGQTPTQAADQVIRLLGADSDHDRVFQKLDALHGIPDGPLTPGGDIDSPTRRRTDLDTPKGPDRNITQGGSPSAGKSN